MTEPTTPVNEPPKEVLVTMGGATINYGKPPFNDEPIITATNELDEQIVRILKQPDNSYPEPLDRMAHVYQCGNCSAYKCPHLTATVNELKALITTAREEAYKHGYIDRGIEELTK